MPEGSHCMCLKRAMEREGIHQLYSRLGAAVYRVVMMPWKVASRDRRIIGLGAVLPALEVTF